VKTAEAPTVDQPKRLPDRLSAVFPQLYRDLRAVAPASAAFLEAERLDPAAVTPADLPPALPELERWKVLRTLEGFRTAALPAPRRPRRPCAKAQLDRVFASFGLPSGYVEPAKHACLCTGCSPPTGETACLQSASRYGLRVEGDQVPSRAIPTVAGDVSSSCPFSGWAPVFFPISSVDELCGHIRARSIQPDGAAKLFVMRDLVEALARAPDCPAAGLPVRIVVQCRTPAKALRPAEPPHTCVAGDARVVPTAVWLRPAEHAQGRPGKRRV